LMLAVDEYQKANLASIEKLKRERHLETKKISGAIKQFLNAHPTLTKMLIGSLTKRIYGALLTDKKKYNKIQQFGKWLFKI
jgi:hypothetical protein